MEAILYSYMEMYMTTSHEVVCLFVHAGSYNAWHSTHAVQTSSM